MSLSLAKIEQAHKLLKEYKGSNPYLIKLRNNVFAYQIKSMNDFEAEYVLYNHDKEPRLINKIVKLADWYGERLQVEWRTEFTPQKVKITYLLGETNTFYHFFCIYRRSQEKAIDIFAPKKGILTDFLIPSFETKEIDFTPYNKRSGITLYPHQENAVKFLTTRKKAILADLMGLGKSISAIVSALEDKYEKVLIVCPASLKSNWKKELMQYVDENEITIVEGSNWKENKFTIINYDILKNFYEVPTETVKRKELNMLDDGQIVKIEKEKEVVSKKKDVISDAMENSQLFQSKFDLMIVDEAHRLSNTTSGIFKIMSDLVKRSNPKGIYLLTGTPITNKPINFFNLLKLIDAPLASDWKHYVERYCDGKHFFNKKERDAHTAIFLKGKGKTSWYDLTYDEKEELNRYLERRCKVIWVTGGASHLDELQEVVKPYYIRRDKSDLQLVKKTIKVLNYDLTEEEKESYDKVWEEYTNANKEKHNLEKYKKITEGILLRQWLANAMVGKTIKLVNEIIKNGEKVIIFCAFDEELNALKEAFKDICVVHNGKMTAKKKDESVEKFKNDNNIKVFIGNLQSASVGLTLVVSNTVVFNSFSWVPGENDQAMDRVHRLNQTKDVTIYYQVFNNTFYKEMLEKVLDKQEIINNIIISEKEK